MTRFEKISEVVTEEDTSIGSGQTSGEDPATCYLTTI
jgi:hypothetical protein